MMPNNGHFCAMVTMRMRQNQGMKSRYTDFWSIYSLKIYLHTHGQYAWAAAPGHILHSPPFSLFSLGSLTQPSPVMIRQCTAGDEGPVADISCMTIFSHFQGLLTTVQLPATRWSDLDFLLNSTLF